MLKVIAPQRRNDTAKSGQRIEKNPTLLGSIRATLATFEVEREMWMTEWLVKGSSLDDYQAFKVALWQALRNVPFFSVQAFLIAFLPGLLGWFGVIIAGLFVAVLAFFVAQDVLTLAVGLFIIVGYSLSRDSAIQPRWVAASCVLNTLQALAYTSLGYYVGWFAGWWGA
jgi:hypothetical protein